MHVASGDQFVSFKAGGDRRDGNFFFYRVFPFLARPLDSVGGGIDRMGWQTDEPRQLSQQNDVYTLFFLLVGDFSTVDFLSVTIFYNKVVNVSLIRNIFLFKPGLEGDSTNQTVNRNFK